MQTFSYKDLHLKNKSDMAKKMIARVNAYFKSNKLSKKGDWRLFSKAAFFFIGFWFVFYLLVFSDISGWVRVLLCPVEAFLASGIGFCIMHDGNHGAFSEKYWVNRTAAATSECLGVSSGIWGTKHNVVHHDGVNVVGVDEDIEAWPLLRLHDEQPRLLIHRWQHYYWPVAYSLLYFILPIKDFFKYFSGRVMGSRLRFTITDHLLFWGGKLFFGVMLIWIPIVKLGFHTWALGFLAFGGILGFLLSVIFQPAHVVRGVKNSTVESAKDGDSMEHQLAHTANFAPRNRFLRWWVGGLNFQIEHHAFRMIAHVHLPKVHEIVSDVCKEFNFPIVVFPTFRSAIASHIGKLKDLSRKLATPAVVS